jgi:hypothetical protein
MTTHDALGSHNSLVTVHDKNLLCLLFANFSDINVEMSSFDLRLPDCYHSRLGIDLRTLLVTSLFYLNYVYSYNAILPHAQMTVLCVKGVSSADSAVY